MMSKDDSLSIGSNQKKRRFVDYVVHLYTLSITVSEGAVVVVWLSSWLAEQEVGTRVWPL